MKYNLANYILSIEPNDATIKNMFGVISVGGEGSAVGSITANLTNDMWSTESYNTGAWVHSKNMSRTGTVTVNISQVSKEVAKFIKMCKLFYGGDYDGFTLSVSDISGTKVCTAVDAYIQKIPNQEFGATAAQQAWTFTCGQLSFD